MRSVTARLPKLAERSWLLPLAAVLVVYARTAGYPLVWDDLVLSTRPVYTGCDLAMIWTSPANGFEYLPVRDLTLCFDHAVFDEWAGGFHATNVFFFGLAVLLLLPLYRRLFGAARTRAFANRAPLLALLATLVFALHPLQVEAVAFVTGRNAVLALSCLVGALLAYARSLESGGRVAYWGSVGLVAAALLSKATALPAPALIFLLHLYLVREDSLARVLRDVAPHCLVALALGTLHLLVAQQAAIPSDTPLYEVLYRLPRAAFIAQFYVGKFLWPVRLTTEYLLGDVRENFALFALATAAVALGSVAVVLHGLRARTLACGLVLAYWVSLVPVMNLLPTIPTVADRYAQIPLLFLAPLAVVALGRWVPTGSVIAVSALSLSALLLASHAQVEVWRTQESVFRKAIGVDPRALVSWERLAYTYLETNRRAEAIEAFRLISEVDSSEERHLAYGAHEALDRGDARRGDALAARVTGRRPHNHLVFVVLGEYWQKRGYDDRAIAWYDRAAIDARKVAHRDPNAQQALAGAERRIKRLRGKASESDDTSQQVGPTPGDRLRSPSR